MEKQPAKINYFFGQCYHDLGRTIRNTFRNLGSSVSNCAYHISDVWGDGGYMHPLGIVQIGFWLGLLICSAIISTVICLVFSTVHIILTLLIMSLIYIMFSFLWLLDTLLCKIKKIRSACPHCQNKFALPYYQCPSCGRLHTKLKPSKYGILKRECDCGRKLPTTFFNGRQKLTAICPFCGEPIKGGGYNTSVSIPVIGGPSSGKTCYLNMALRELEKIAEPELGYEYEYIEQGTDNLRANLMNMDAGELPDKTMDMRLVYYDFNFTPKKKKVKNRISLCDVGGEVYAEGDKINSQIGYNNANAYLMVVDPLSIAAFKAEAEQKGDISGYGGSEMRIDEILSILIKTLENMRNLSTKQKIEEDLAVVFTKCDMPLIDEKIGEKAVKDFIDANPKSNVFEARNALCEQFLAEYDETGFLNTVKSKFTTVQYFTCSALGHNVDGTAFTPSDVVDPILWLIDKKSPTIDLKKYWDKELKGN